MFHSCYNNYLDSIYTKWVEVIWRIFTGQEGMWGLHANIMHAILCNEREQSCISQVLESMPQEYWGLTTESNPEQENTEFLFLRLIIPIFKMSVYMFICVLVHMCIGACMSMPKCWGQRITLSNIPRTPAPSRWGFLLGLELTFRLDDLTDKHQGSCHSLLSPSTIRVALGDQTRDPVLHRPELYWVSHHVSPHHATKN